MYECRGSDPLSCIPRNSSVREYLWPFIIWHSSALTYPKVKTFPSQGELIELGSSSGAPLVILRVKKEQNVGYSLRGSSTS